jgi:hypothetical protein
MADVNYHKGDKGKPKLINPEYPARAKSGDMALGKRLDSNKVVLFPNQIISKEKGINWQILSKRKIKSLKHIKHKCLFRKRMVVDVEDINSEYKLVRLVRNNYGYGKFHLQFWNRFKRSKTYNPEFTCKGKWCKYFNSTSIRYDGTRQLDCKVKNKKKVGVSCRRNRRIIRAFDTKATVIIKKGIHYLTEEDFIYEYSKNTMYSFPWWEGDIEPSIKRKKLKKSEQSDEEELQEEVNLNL